MNHVLNYYHVSPHLVLFRELMKKSVTWYWEGALEKLFEASRELIAKSVMDRITRYDKTRWKAVFTDWFKSGILYIIELLPMPRDHACFL